MIYWFPLMAGLLLPIRMDVVVITMPCSHCGELAVWQIPIDCSKENSCSIICPDCHVPMRFFTPYHTTHTYDVTVDGVTYHNITWFSATTIGNRIVEFIDERQRHVTIVGYQNYTIITTK